MFKQFLYVLKGLISLTIIPISASPNPSPNPLIPSPFPSPNSRTQTQTGYTDRIPREIQNGTANARFKIPTPNRTLNTTSRLILDTPQISKVTTTSFDWWYFDAVSTTSPAESLTITLFTSSSSAFPWLDSSESSVLIAYLWASIANGSVFEQYLPATIATVSESSSSSSSGLWSDTGFTWVAGEELSSYRVTVESEEMGVYGTFIMESELSPHLPCGIQDEISTLEIVPNIGWASLLPDADAVVDMNIQGSRLSFQGRGYHDKNWSNLSFTESISSWYWGHGRIGVYSIVWFSAIANNETYTSSYVARNDQVLVSSCENMLLTVRPAGYVESNSNSTAARYPPRAGDIPDGFTVEAYLGEGVWLKVNVSIVALVTGDGEYYMRWSGGLVGSLVDSGGRIVDAGKGVAVFEQFALEK